MSEILDQKIEHLKNVSEKANVECIINSKDKENFIILKYGVSTHSISQQKFINGRNELFLLPTQLKRIDFLRRHCRKIGNQSLSVLHYIPSR